MKVTLIGQTKGLLKIPEQAAAICTDSVNAEGALKYALSCGHESVIEHQSYSFLIEGISRVTLAQLTRHRLASFSVQSQRYVNQGDSACIVPPSIVKDEKLMAMVKEFINNAGVLYEYLIAHGIEQEDARYILPQGTETQLVMTMNARELRHFFSLRMCRRAQWEIRQLADRMYELVYAEAPELFGDAGPGCVRGHCPEGKKSCKNPRKLEIDDMKESL